MQRWEGRLCHAKSLWGQMSEEELEDVRKHDCCYRWSRAGERRCNITELVKERMACETGDKSKDYDSTWGRESWEGFNDGVSVTGRMEGWHASEHSIPALPIGTC